MPMALMPATVPPLPPLPLFARPPVPPFPLAKAVVPSDPVVLLVAITADWVTDPPAPPLPVPDAAPPAPPLA